MTTRKKRPRDDDALKRAVVEAAIAHAAFDGFTDRVLARAASECDLDKAATARLFPAGAPSLVETYSLLADADMEKQLARVHLPAMKVRERIAIGVKTRLAVLKPNKEAARRAAAFLSLPQNFPLATKLLYCTVDSMWRAAGDTSTDFSFYTKRGILAGVYSTTLVRWFNDQSEDEHETSDFLAARIENVMQFEKLKAQVREGFSRIFPQTT
jgi:ubiquinone biosynthesis protein COQ9